MQVTITCPHCGASLKANRTPASDKLLRCLKCKHWFTFGEMAITASAPGGSPTPSRGRPVLLALAALFLIALTAGATYWLTRPGPAPVPPVVSENPPPKKEAPPEVVTALPMEKQVDPEEEQRREKLTQLLINGGIALQLKRWDEAVVAYNEASKMTPDDAEVRQKLQEAQAGHEVAAKDRQAQEAVKKEAEALLEKGQEALQKKQPGAALEFFKLALQKSPTSSEAAAALTEAQQAMQAEADRKAKLEKFDGHILSGKAALRGGEPVKAMAEFMAAGKILPQDPLVPELLKDAEKQVGKMKDEGVRNKNVQELLDEAKDLARRNRLDQALALYQQAVKLAPNNAAAVKGLEDTKMALKDAQGPVNGVMQQAQAQIRQGQIQQALATYNQGLTLYPGNENLLRMLQIAELIRVNQAAYYLAMNQGSAALAAQRFAEAVLAFSEALRIVPNDPLALDGLVQAQRLLNEQNRIRQRYDALFNLGMNQLRAFRYGDAARDFAQALTLVKPPLVPDPQVRVLIRYCEAMGRANVALRVAQWNEAALMFTAALREIPNDAAAQIGLQKARQGQAKKR